MVHLFQNSVLKQQVQKRGTTTVIALVNPQRQAINLIYRIDN